MKIYIPLKFEDWEGFYPLGDKAYDAMRDAIDAALSVHAATPDFVSYEIGDVEPPYESCPVPIVPVTLYFSTTGHNADQMAAFYIAIYEVKS